MHNCRFCQIVNNEEVRKDEEIIFENDEFLVITDKYRRTSVGAICLLIPKQHKSDLLELHEDTGEAFVKTLKLIGKSMQKAYNCKGIRIWSAVDKEAGQSIFHCHVHIVPCKSIADRLIAAIPGLYDYSRRLFKVNKKTLGKELNFDLADKIRNEIVVNK